MQNAERRMQNDFIPLTLHSQGNELNAECGTTLFECGVRNYPTTLRFVHKERMISAECGARSTERPHSANAPLTRKIIFLSV